MNSYQMMNLIIIDKVLCLNQFVLSQIFTIMSLQMVMDPFIHLVIFIVLIYFILINNHNLDILVLMLIPYFFQIVDLIFFSSYLFPLFRHHHLII